MASGVLGGGGEKEEGMTQLTALLARFMRGRLSRREFSDRVLGLGFGAVTAESILDNAAAGQEKALRFEPFSQRSEERRVGKECRL